MSSNKTINETQSRRTLPAIGPKPSELRARAFIFGLALIPVNQYWVLMMEKVREGPYPTTFSLFANAVFMLALLVALNSIVRRLRPSLAFSSAEMLLIYTMVAISTALAGHDMMPTLVGMIAYPWRHATPENGWAQTFMPYLPKDLSVRDPEALKALWEGSSNLYAYGYWKLWVWPVLNWLAFIVALFFVMMCINTIVRKQWMERERLTFPIVQLPLAMTDPKGQIWRSRLFWLGFGISAGIVLVNGLTVYLPWLPKINVGFENRDLAQGLVDKPWSAIGWTPISFYPFVIGLGYLLPLDLIFSSWFFYLFWKFEKLISAMMGWDAVPDFPYIRQQVFGGLVAIIVTIIWTSKGYLKQVWRKIWNQSSELDDSDEPMSYRAAFFGGLLGLGFCTAFMMRLGASLPVAIAIFVAYFIIATAIARVRAELGPPVHDMHFTNPDMVITSLVGADRLKNGDIVALGHLYWFNRAYRAQPMSIGIEGMKAAEASRASQRKFLLGMMLAITAGVIATFWAYLHIGYKLGFDIKAGGGGYSWGAFRNLEYMWGRPEDLAQPNMGGNLGMLFGFSFCMLLSYLRLHLLKWPFHPIGYVISGSYQINLVWVPLLIAWAIKGLILKFGGLKLYKSAMPFFLGLILGEITLGCIWSIIGIVFNIPYYNFWGQ